MCMHTHGTGTYITHHNYTFKCTLGQELCTEENEIRLSTAGGYFGDGTSGAGRVEICYCDGTCSWSTINAVGSAWSWPNTLVACRQLGYSTSYNPIIGTT